MGEFEPLMVMWDIESAIPLFNIYVLRTDVFMGFKGVMVLGEGNFRVGAAVLAWLLLTVERRTDATLIFESRRFPCERNSDYFLFDLARWQLWFQLSRTGLKAFGNFLIDLPV